MGTPARGRQCPVVIFFHRSTEWYPSLAECSRTTGISRWRLKRGLADPEGVIPNSRPPAYIDEALDSGRSVL